MTHHTAAAVTSISLGVGLYDDGHLIEWIVKPAVLDLIDYADAFPAEEVDLDAAAEALASMGYRISTEPNGRDVVTPDGDGGWLIDVEEVA